MVISKKNRSLLIAALIVGAAITILFLYPQGSSKPVIKKFNENKDAEFIADMFNKNWYWLIENPNFSVDNLLYKMSPTNNPEDFGKEHIDVLYVKNEPVGFVTYHKKNFYEGFLHFLLVDEQQRGKGYAEMLMKHAIDKLKQMGSKVIRLVTRSSNKAAQKLYDKLGFIKYNEQNNFVYYELK